MLSRLKFEIESLFQEIYDERLPETLFMSETTTFADLQSAGLQSIIPLVNKLRKYGHSDENIRSRVFAFMENDVYLNYVQVKNSDLPVTFDIYKETINMKFDVLVGNDPYQEKVGPKKTEPLWNKFFFKRMSLLKEGGYLSLIHPSGWRNIDGKFKDVQQLIKSKNVVYLSINDEKTGIEVFGATTSFDWYVIENKKNNLEITKVETSNGEIFDYNINNLDFIPGGEFELFQNLVASSNEERVTVLYSRSAYGTDKSNVSKIQGGDFIYPCIYTIIKNGDINFYWSNTNENGFFGVPKIMWSNGMSSQPTLDLNGDYGLTQFAYAIQDTPENLIKIREAMYSTKFLNTMKFCYMSSGNRFDRKILSTFRKDFWKDFIDD